MPIAGARVDPAEPEMSAGDEGMHPQLVGQGPGLLEVAR